MGGCEMKSEIECRALDVDVKDLLNKLKANNARFVGDWLQVRNCYDFNPVRENSWIRLRTNGKETTLTIKEIQGDKIGDTKESEIVVSDFNTTDEILNKLGYHARSKQMNRRIRYILDGVEVDIDFWPQIPANVEFEAEGEEKIYSVCEKLGIDQSRLVSYGVEDVYRHYGLTIKNMPVMELEKQVQEQEFEC